MLEADSSIYENNIEMTLKNPQNPNNKVFKSL